MTSEEALETAKCMEKSLETGDMIEPETQSITLEYSSYIDNTLTFKPMDPKDMKVKIWDKELTSVAEWEDFLKVVEEKEEENKQLKERIQNILEGKEIPAICAKKYEEYEKQLAIRDKALEDMHEMIKIYVKELFNEEIIVF